MESKFFLENYRCNIESELSINIVKALSSKFDISYYKDNSVHRLSYNNGILEDELIENIDAENGTLIVFTPDEIFLKDFDM